MTTIWIIEDDRWTDFAPITDNRPIYTIPFGGRSLLDRIRPWFPGYPTILHCRPGLSELLKELEPEQSVNPSIPDGPTALINGRVVMTARISTHMITAMQGGHPTLITTQNDWIALILPNGKDIKTWLASGRLSAESIYAQFEKKCDQVELADVTVFQTLTSPLSELNMLLNPDPRVTLGIDETRFGAQIALLNPAQIHIADSVQVDPFAVIDARKGPVVIADHAIIHSHSRLEGPLYIGAHSQILGGVVRGSSIGPHCKISGEMSQCIVAGYTNKAHDGFFGNSYLGYWVNIGADSVTSNLKNTYGAVSLERNGVHWNSNQQFLGSIIGDHAKLGIGTHLATGTIIGTGASISGTGIHDKWIPPFSWVTDDTFEPYDIDKWVVTARRVMARRKLELSAATETHMRQLWEDTQP
ncbi:hypothetical protein EBR96_03270 [bacterium]|nr:hypothetical protein [bacterium]